MGWIFLEKVGGGNVFGVERGVKCLFFLWKGGRVVGFWGGGEEGRGIWWGRGIGVSEGEGDGDRSE